MRTAEGLAGVVDDFDSDRRARPARVAALQRLGDPARLQRRPPRAPGEGCLGREGCAAFLSEPRFEGMPVILEGPGMEGKGIVPEDIAFAGEMREEGRAARKA